MKKQKKALAVICALGAIGAGAALVACNDNVQPAPPGKYLPNYTFPPASTHPVDENITLDGKLDDDAYKNTRWMEIRKENGTETATMRMTSYFGEQGVYMGFDVTESGRIYVNHERASYFNSGIEMYLATQGTKSQDSDTAFEVDMEADGTLTFKRRVKGGWVPFHTTTDIMATLVSTTKGGEVNEESCYGYTLELFMPYEYLVWLGVLEDGERPEEFYVNPVLISSYSYSGTKLNVDRYWYNTVFEQLDGDGWTPPTNYHFNANGLVSHDINVTCTGDGTVGEYRGYNYAVDKNNLTLKAEAKAGSRLKSLKINGVERKNDLVNGMITLPTVTADVNIVAEFENTPSQKGTISGAVTYTGTDSAFYDDAEVRAFDGTNTYTSTIDETTGAYSIEAPIGEYQVSVMSVTGGYAAASVNANLESSITVDFDIDDTMYGANRTLYLNDVVLSGGSKELYTKEQDPIASDRFVYKTFLGLADNALKISTANRYVTEQWLYCGGEWVRFQIMNWEGGYNVKLIWKDNGKERDVSASITGAAKELMDKLNGMYLAFIRDGSEVSVAYLNAQGNWTNLINKVSVSTFADGAALTAITLSGQEGVSGEYPTAAYGGVIVQGTTDPARLPAVNVTAVYDKTAVTLSGLQGKYAIGSTVSFNATPAENYLLKVYLNGEELAKSGDGYTFTMLGRADLRFETVKNEPQKLSLNIRGYKFGDYTDLDGVQVTLKGIKDYTATIDKGVIQIDDMIAGEYEIIIAGYGTKIVNFGKDESVTLDFKMFGPNAAWELTEQNVASPVIYANAGRCFIASESKFGDFFMETELKYNAQLAATASSTSADEYTQRKGYDILFSNGKSLQPSLNYHGISFSPLNESTAIAGSSWSDVYRLTDAEIAKYHGEGIKLGVMRIGRGVTVTVDGKPVAEFLLPEGYEDITANVGYHQYHGRGLGKQAYAFTFSDQVSNDVTISEDSVISGCKVELEGTPKVGGTVKLKVTPTVQDASATLMTFTVNGKEYVSAYANGAITIENCCSNKLVIVAKFAKPKFAATVEAGMWNLSDIDKGDVSCTGWGVLGLGTKTDFTASVDYRCNTGASESRREIILYFPDSKKFVSFGAMQKGNEAFVQSCGGTDTINNSGEYDGTYNSIYGWANMLNNRDFNETERAMLFGDGLNVTIAKSGATVHLFIDGVFERTFDLTSALGENAATATCLVKMRTWEGGFAGKTSRVMIDDNTANYLAGTVVIDADIKNGTVTADKTSYNPLAKDEITLTLTPATGYKIKSLTVNGKDVSDAIVNGTYKFTGVVGRSTVTAEFMATTGVATDKITLAAIDENGNATIVSAGKKFTFTNIANSLVYTATTAANGALTFESDGKPVSEIATLAYKVTSPYCADTSVTVTADGAVVNIAYKTVGVACDVAENTQDVNLNALVGMNKVLAYERWISEWDTEIDTVDPHSLLSGSKYWTLSGTTTARPENTTYGAITSGGGYLIKGLKGQEEYESWAPIIMSETVSHVKVRKDVTKLRVYAGKWWGNQADVTFTLCIGNNVYASKTVAMGGTSAGHAIVEFDFDTTDMSANALIEFELKISSSASDGYSVAGLQLLGKLA